MIIPKPYKTICGQKLDGVKEIHCSESDKDLLIQAIPNYEYYLCDEGGKYYFSTQLQELSNISGAYKLTVSDREIKIIANNSSGLFYGLQSLEQLLKSDNFRQVEIIDYPKYQHRGLLIDCSRHFFPIDILKRKIDLMASLKLNVFHWHLTDDQGFRIEIKQYPLLTRKGSKRSKTLLLDGLKEVPVEGFYTKKQIKELVIYAKKRHIQIIPEFDMPGHFSSLIACYPELSCKEESIDVPYTYGVHKTIACVGRDSTINFIKNVLDEIIELFPSPYIHLGGDEAPKDRWRNCSHCQSRMKIHNLVNENHLQSWFMNEIVDYMMSKGKTVIGWNDGINECSNSEIICQHWYDGKKMTNTIKEGNSGRKMIISDARYLYFDYPYELTPIKKTYNFNLALDGLHKDVDIIGGEMAIWTEYVEDEATLDHMLIPRIYAGAEVFWSEPSKDYSDFIKRLKHLLGELHFDKPYWVNIINKMKYKNKQKKMEKLLKTMNR